MGSSVTQLINASTCVCTIVHTLNFTSVSISVFPSTEVWEGDNITVTSVKLRGKLILSG